MTLLTQPGPYTSSTLPNGLAAYYKLDEANGVALDSGPNGLTLTDTNTVGAAAGQIGGARLFVAAQNEWLSRADHAALSIAGSCAFSLWAKLTTKSGAMRLISKDDGAASREYALYWDPSDRFIFAVFVGGVGGGFKTVTATAFGAVSAGVWHYINCGYNASTQTIYISVNGGAVNTTASVASVFNGSASFTLGNYLAGTTSYLNGALDEVKIWNTRILTPAEIAEDYANGLAGRSF